MGHVGGRSDPDRFEIALENRCRHGYEVPTGIERGRSEADCLDVAVRVDVDRKRLGLDERRIPQEGSGSIRTVGNQRQSACDPGHRLLKGRHGGSGRGEYIGIGRVINERGICRWWVLVLDRTEGGH